MQQLKNRTSKYRSKKQEVDGIVFDSKKEAARYQELKLLQKTGKINNLQLQVPFVLIPSQYEYHTEYTKTGKPKEVKKQIERKVKYIADFVYNQDGETIVEDVKGYREKGAYSLFVIKRKLMLQVHGIKVREI